jgi:hypothetical protein
MEVVLHVHRRGVAGREDIIIPNTTSFQWILGGSAESYGQTILGELPRRKPTGNQA